MNISIKRTNNMCKGPCPLCGTPTRADIPIWGFVDNRAVCEPCLEEHDLEGMGHIRKAQKLYEPMYEDTGGTQKPEPDSNLELPF